MLMGFGAPPPLVLAAFSGETEVAGVPTSLVAPIPAAFFVDGGFAEPRALHTPEVFPTSLRTHGMGLAWAVSGLGRIIGPLVIALVAGTGDLVDPEATLDALAPSFLFLAVAALLVGVAFPSSARAARPRPRNAGRGAGRGGRPAPAAQPTGANLKTKKPGGKGCSGAQPDRRGQAIP